MPLVGYTLDFPDKSYPRGFVKFHPGTVQADGFQGVLDDSPLCFKRELVPMCNQPLNATGYDVAAPAQAISVRGHHHQLFIDILV